MLAVSIEDRPFMPISSVILGGAPKEFKALFRTWDNACPAVLNPQQQQNPAAPVKQQPAASGMRRARSIRLVGLSEAMEAMSV